MNERMKERERKRKNERKKKEERERKKRKGRTDMPGPALFLRHLQGNGLSWDGQSF
jgi:hypothetical protein